MNTPSDTPSPPSFFAPCCCSGATRRQDGKAAPKPNAATFLAVLAVVFVLAGVSSFRTPTEDASTPSVAANRGTVFESPGGPAPTARLPRLVEVGGEKCIPCLQMAPILEELAREYRGRVEIEKIDLGKIPSAQYVYAIQAIPTQIFLTADAKEFWRHEGTLTKEEIVAKFAQMGVPRTLGQTGESR